MSLVEQNLAECLRAQGSAKYQMKDLQDGCASDGIFHTTDIRP